MTRRRRTYGFSMDPSDTPEVSKNPERSGLKLVFGKKSYHF